MRMCLLPMPSNIRYFEEKREWKFPVRLALPDSLQKLMPVLLQVCPDTYTCVREEGDVRFLYVPGLGQEAYGLTVTALSVEIAYATERGAFYGLVTLWQMLRQQADCTCRIQDAPALPHRGFMMDISRGKVPCLDTLKKLADLLARMKYNQLQLYIEGFSFAYPGYEKYTDRQSSLSPQEVRELDSYCRERFLELVPNQNSLGHMAPWLAKDELRHMAETEEGFEVQGIKIPPTTLDASDPESLNFVTGLMDGLLPDFTSGHFHAGLDEAFELGRGKNKDKDRTRLFTDYTKKLYNEVCKRNKTMMMWADGISKDPRLCAALSGETAAGEAASGSKGTGSSTSAEILPQDIILMEWGYEKDHPFASRCAFYAKAGRKFYVCPGTSSHLSVTGLTDNMLTNIRQAVKAAIKYGGEGILLTDWGDLNHLQYLPVSFPGIAYCGALAWNSSREPVEEQLARGLDSFLFMENNCGLGQLALDAGRYYQREEFQLPSRTLAILPLSADLKGREDYEKHISFLLYLGERLSAKEVIAPYIDSWNRRKEPSVREVLAYTEGLLQRMETIRPHGEDAGLARAELRNALRLVELLTKCRGRILGIPCGEISQTETEDILREHKRLWLARNKESGLKEGIRSISRLKQTE